MSADRKKVKVVQIFKVGSESADFADEYRDFTCDAQKLTIATMDRSVYMFPWAALSEVRFLEEEE